MVEVQAVGVAKLFDTAQGSSFTIRNSPTGRLARIGMTHHKRLAGRFVAFYAPAYLSR